MEEHIDHLRKMSAELMGELQRCAVDVEVESVHRVRTGTRRVQAMAETVVRESNGDKAELQNALANWLRLLKKIRRAAGPVRDLDVHRKLLEKLPERARKQNQALAANVIGYGTAPPNGSATGIGSGPAPPPTSALEQQADAFDVWLKHSRESLAIKLRKEIQRRSDKLVARETDFETVLRKSNDLNHRAVARHAVAVALENFVRLSEQTPHLDDANLHDFRKGAKKARYVAESGGDDAASQVVSKTLKTLQDDIGDWHDWLLMAEEARAALGDRGGDIIAMLDMEVASHYVASLKTATRLRGRLMGEWQAQTTAPKRRVRKKLPTSVPHDREAGNAAEPVNSNR